MVKYTDTTVKLEAAVVKEVSSVLEPDQTLTSYVREVVYRDVKRKKLKLASRAYREFLEQNPEEKEEMESWENADLASTPAVPSATSKRKR
jgi:hypothetical protein